MEHGRRTRVDQDDVISKARARTAELNSRISLA